MSRSRSVQPARFGFKALAALAAGLLAGFTTGVAAVHAAPGDESHAAGTYLSGSLLTLLTPLQLAELASAVADNDGTQATQTDDDPLNATILQALSIEVAPGVQIPLNVADVGALSSFAQAEADGSSVGASGLVGDDGAIGVGEVDPAGIPSPMTLDLSDILGTTFATEIANLTFELEATSANAVSIQAGAPVGDYEIVGSQLVLDSNTLDGVTDEIDTLVEDLGDTVNDLTGPDGSLVSGVLGVVNDTLDSLGVLVPGDVDASITVDLPAAVAPLLATPLDAGSGISIDLAEGQILIDLSLLNGGTLNGLGPNTNILTSTQLSAISTAVTNRLALLADDIETVLTTALENAEVLIDVDVDLLVVPLVNVTVSGSIAEILAGDGVFGVSALGAIDVSALTDALLEPIVQGLLAPLLDTTTGALATLITGLQTEVLDPVLTNLNPLLLLLDDVILLTVNNQDPVPTADGDFFTETALRLQLLPEASGPLGDILELNVAQATVGPNVVAAVLPTITDIDPVEGPESGGTIVTITGTGFTDASGVTFDGLAGTAFSVDSDTQITVTTPPHAPELVDVVVQHPDGDSLPGEFLYTPLGAVTDIDPNVGPTAGGTVVTITGTCFTDAEGVTFDGLDGTAFEVVSDTEILVTTPPHVEGVVDVIVEASLDCGGDVVVVNGFTYVADDAPEILEIDPDNGPESGGTIVTITGTGFTGASGVTFDGLSGTVFSVDSDAQITVTTPAHLPGIVDVVVVHPSGDSGPVDFTYTPLVSVTEVDPDEGPTSGGTDVTITGTCFTGATGVTFDGIPGTNFVVVNDTTITVTTPPHASGFVDVVVQGSLVCGGDEEVPDGFEYLAPVITDLDPDNGPESGGTVVTITGENFTGASGVTFDGLPGTAFSVDSDTQITVSSPAHAPATVDVIVLTEGEDSEPADFTYTPLVSVIDIDPGFGPTEGGTEVTITGTCFTGATGVTFDGVPGTEFEVVSDTVITVTTPPHAEGAVDVIVQGSLACGGDEFVEDGFTYVGEDAPEITGLDPDNGPESGGTVVTVTGTGFTGATGVTFDGAAGSAFTVDSDTQITVTTPPHAPELVDVVVVHPDGNSGPQDFLYTPLVSVTEIDPDSGPEEGGTDVTITGTCFTGATGVEFDGVPGTNFVVVSDTTITVTTPPGGPGFVDVTILGSVVCGGEETVPDGFEYIATDAPVILSLVPNEGPYTGGTPVLVTGEGFVGSTGVTFDGASATSVVVVDDENITLVSPPGEIGPADVVILHPNGNSAALTFTYLPATTIDDVDPPEGPEKGGTEVVITGSCFTGATGVYFGDIPATSFRVIDDTTIIAIAPPGVGIVDVTVIGSDACGDGELEDGYRYIPAALPLTGLMTPLPALGGALGLVIIGLVIVVTRRSREA